MKKFNFSVLAGSKDCKTVRELIKELQKFPETMSLVNPDYKVGARIQVFDNGLNKQKLHMEIVPADEECRYGDC